MANNGLLAYASDVNVYSLICGSHSVLSLSLHQSNWHTIMYFDTCNIAEPPVKAWSMTDQHALILNNNCAGQHRWPTPVKTGQRGAVTQGKEFPRQMIHLI